MKLISVIVPVYKVEKYLDKCIQSIVDQTYKNIELILVDDGSPDRCGKMCDEWATRDSRITVIHKQNGGLSDARNFGIDIAKGELLAFIDSDDYIEKNYLENLYKLLVDNRADISTCKPSVFFENEINSHLYEILRNDDVVVLSSKEALIEMLYERNLTNSAWGKLYKKELFKDIRYPKGKLYEDMFTTYKLIMKSNRVACSSAKLYNYLIRKNSILGTINPNKQKDMLDAANEILDYVENSVPSALEAAKYKLFMVSMTILVQCDLFNKKHNKIINLLWKNIKKNRIKVALNRKVEKKYRFLALVSLAGRRTVQLFYKIIAKR